LESAGAEELSAGEGVLAKGVLVDCMAAYLVGPAAEENAGCSKSAEV
jgi:hypothetical protein